MSFDRVAAIPVLIYLVLFAVALLAGVDIGADEFLFEEGTHATYITAPFSILQVGFFSFVGVGIFESSAMAYFIWLTSAALNSVAIYMLTKRTYAMLGFGRSAVSASVKS